MASTFTTNKHLEKPAAGDYPGTWGDPVLNAQLNIIDQALGGSVVLACGGVDITLTKDTVSAQANNLIFYLQGVLTNNINIIFPDVGAQYFIINQTTGAFNIALKTSYVTSSTVNAPQGYRIIVRSSTSVGMEMGIDAIPYAAPIPGPLTLSSFISPATIGTDQDDYNPTSLSVVTYVRLSASAAVNITGLAGGTAGRCITLHNVGSTFPITLPPNNGASAAANRFSFPAPVVLRPNTSIDLQYDGISGLWRSMSPQQTTSGSAYSALKCNTASDSVAIITADSLVVTDSVGNTVRLTAVSVTANNTLSGAGGIDAGAVASSTWYSIWVIYNPTSNAAAGLLSTSASAPTMPSGYTFKVRVGWNSTNGSSQFHRVIQYGTRAQYVIGANPTIPTVLANGVAGTYSVTSPTLAAVTVTGVGGVPSTAASILLLATDGWKTQSVGVNCGIMVAPSTSWGGTNNGPYGSNGMIWPIFQPTLSNGAQAMAGPTSSIEMVLESTTIAWASLGAGGALACAGWVDNI